MLATLLLELVDHLRQLTGETETTFSSWYACSPKTGWVVALYYFFLLLTKLSSRSNIFARSPRPLSRNASIERSHAETLGLCSDPQQILVGSDVKR